MSIPRDQAVRFVPSEAQPETGGSALTNLQRLGRLRPLEEGLQEILTASIELLGADKGNVQLLDSERGVLQIAAQRGFGQDFLEFFREVSAEEGSACGKALRCGERIVIDDVEADPDYAPCRPIARASGFRSVQSTPLIGKGGKCVGMLSTHFRSVHRPTEEDLRRLDLYARQAADFIERIGMEDTRRVRARQQEAIAKLGELALREEDLDRLFGHATATIAETLEIEYAKVLELRASKADLLLRAGFGWHDGKVGNATVATGTYSQAGYTLLSDAPVVVVDFREEQRFAAPRLLVDHGVVSGMSCVMRNRDREPWGVLGAHSTRQKVFSQDDVNFLFACANLLSNAIRRHSVEQALRESDQRFRLVADSAPVLIWMSGPDKLCTWFNQRWLDFVGRTMEQELGDGWAENVHAEDFDACLNNYSSAFDARHPFSMEYRLRRHDGTYRWVLDEGVPRFSPTGDFAGYIGSCIDVTERKRVEQALRDSAARMTAIVDTAIDAILVIDETGVIDSVNPATEGLFDYAAGEMVGRNIKMLMPERYAAEHDSYIQRYRHTGQRKIIGFGREVTGRRKDGSTFPMHLSVSECEIDGKCHFAGIVRDLTARENAEIGRLRQQSLFEATINDAPQAIVIADSNRNIFLVNPAVSRIFGYEPLELVGQSLRTLYAHQEEQERVLRLAAQYDAAMAHAEPIRAMFRRKSGEEFPGEVIATIIHDRQGNVLGLMRFIRDVTEQLKQEEMLSQNLRMDALGQLTAGIAHDFNNLLTVIVGSLELADGASDKRHGQDLMREANDAAKMGARLTERLLSFSRQRKLELTVVNLNELISNMMELLRRSIGETIAVSTSLAKTLTPARVDPSEFENTILNLAINSRDAMPNGGRLIIETQNLNLTSADDCAAHGIAPGDYARVSVTDTGSGMPPEVAARAFEPFFTTKPPGRGTGLGLASIYGFVKQSGGHATISSEAGRGTTVHVYLPSVPQVEATKREDRATEPAAAAGETVLVVEDNPQLRRLSVRRVELLGYRTREADNGPSAIAILEKHNINLIFSDVVMPGGMTGYELAAFAGHNYPSLRILLTSGYDVEQQATHDSADSDLRVLRKPYNQADLARALSEAMASEP